MLTQIVFLKNIHSCQNDPEKSSTEKKAEHTPSGYSWITCCSFDASKNEWGYYREKDCMEMFCKDLRNQAMKVINYEKKEMIPLTDKEVESYEKQKVCHIFKKKLVHIRMMKNTMKSEIIVITGENLEELLIILTI